MPRGSLRPNLGLNRAIATVRFDSKGDNAAPGSIDYRWPDNPSKGSRRPGRPHQHRTER